MKLGDYNQLIKAVLLYVSNVRRVVMWWDKSFAGRFSSGANKKSLFLRSNELALEKQMDRVRIGRTH